MPIQLLSDPRSEMVSQALFGETVTALMAHADYTLVRTADGYEGWALTAHLGPVSTETLLRERTVTDAFAQVFTTRAPDDKALTILTRLSMGSRVQVLESGFEITRIVLPKASALGADIGYVATTCLESLQDVDRTPWQVVHHCANQLLGTPYLWGGTSSFGIDCSGFIQRVFGMAGIRLPRDAYQQAQSPLGERTLDTETPTAMDLAFFLGREDPRQRGITHVGVARDSDHFYHSSSGTGVVLARFDDHQIREEYCYVGGLRLPHGQGL